MFQIPEKKVWCFDTGWMPYAHQSCSITPPPQVERGENLQEVPGSKKGEEGSLTNYPHEKYHLRLGKYILIYCNPVRIG